MPLPIHDTFDLPYYSAPIRVALEPVRSAIQSLTMLTHGHEKASPADWVIDTQRAMSQKERKTNDLVLLGLHYAVMPMETWNSFPDYLDHLAAASPESLRDKMLNIYEQTSINLNPEGKLLDLQTALTSPENYITYLRQRFRPENVDEEIEREAFRYVTDPPAMRQLIVDHLRHMWDRYLSAEWERVLPTLQTIVRAYQKIDLKGKSFLEAGRLITGQDLDEKKWAAHFANAQQVVFVPHPHVGPYMPKCYGKNQEIIVFFIAHLPEWMAKDTPDLTRTEIVIRLSALADDTRLRILQLIAENGEQRSQEIMEKLELSQSAASRHLSQLSAGGFLNERRCDGGKCYALNTDRVNNTLQAIAGFLSAKERTGL